MHVLPQLREIERRHPDAVQVVSVHSPKFPTERETRNLREAVLRLRIEHPVLNDADFEYWQRYGARAWPTLFFIDPRGNVIGRHEGELPAAQAIPIVDAMIDEYERAGELSHQPLEISRETGADSVLSFPGKVEWDDAGGRLAIADTNNDRVLIGDIEGNVSLVVGGDGPGFRDGAADEAKFNQPQGMAFDGDALYVADNENHAVRRIDLRDGSVTTIAGTGEQAMMLPQSAPARATQLSSPWDVAVHDGALYVAIAGVHQIWRMPLGDEQAAIEIWAGKMAEGIVDGPRREAELAQPSGLAPGPDGLAFADSESSGVREVAWDPDGRVHTIIGKTGQGGLFHFGDADGGRHQAKLQHPLDVAWCGDELYVADSFNHKIKQVYPRMENVRTLLGGQGDATGPLPETRLNEPGGLSKGPNRTLLIADTNNHRILKADLAAAATEEIQIRLPA